MRERRFFLESLDLFERSKDKEWSFAGCTSFILVEGAGLSQAVAFDPRFEQAGFHMLPYRGFNPGRVS